MKKNILDVCLETLINDYKELNSSYKVAKKHGVSASAVRRVLKNAGVLRNLSEAAKVRGTAHLNYERTEAHRQNLSNLAKMRKGELNPFFGKTHTEKVKQKLSKYAKARTKERNPNYRHGNYEKRPRDFKIHEFKPIKNFVFNRDDYTCKYCKYMGGHLHAHHIIPYWVKPEAFLDPDNLVTVCTKCHFEKAHKGSWFKFDIELVTEKLLKRYSLDCERLTELADFKNQK